MNSLRPRCLLTVGNCVRLAYGIPLPQKPVMQRLWNEARMDYDLAFPATPGEWHVNVAQARARNSPIEFAKTHDLHKWVCAKKILRDRAKKREQPCLKP